MRSVSAVVMMMAIMLMLQSAAVARLQEAAQRCNSDRDNNGIGHHGNGVA